jgi:hypothetical protein
MDNLKKYPNDRIRAKDMRRLDAEQSPGAGIAELLHFPLPLFCPFPRGMGGIKMPKSNFFREIRQRAATCVNFIYER